MPLFNPRTIADALAAYARPPTSDEVAAGAEWAARASSLELERQNESQLEQEFNRLIVQGALGYRAPTPGADGTMRVKQPIASGTVDVALGRFTDTEVEVLAPLELKGPRVRLDRIMPGRAKTPVQQAWEYAMDAPGARWVLVCDMRELRLYAVGHGRAAFEAFDLRKIWDADEFRRLQLLLHADQLLGGATADLLTRSAAHDQAVTNKLYADYRSLRDDLLDFIRDQRPTISAEPRITLVQKLLDRLLFIAFAEDTVLLPSDSLKGAVRFINPYDPVPKWRQVSRLFDWVDRGATEQGISPYNGGLFASDPILDALDLPDHLVERFADLAGYDFKSEVSVTILGHIFEQSITDIEALQAEARHEAPPSTGKRKREGVVYTPDFVTRFIVERTIGVHLAEIADELRPQFSRGEGSDGEVRWSGRTGERDYWAAYLARVVALRVLDPACGSGAFLIAAFDFLHDEQRRVRTRLAELDPGLLVHATTDADVEIITRNLYGVDVNAESVEITKLALWLKTAKPGRQLSSLDDNIRVGNSIVESSDFHQRSFEWRREFSEILHGGPDAGFDIVLGNPPYVRMELLKPIKPYLESRYEVVSDRADLYAYFFELGVRVLKPGGRLGYISSSTFFRTGSGAPLRRYLATHAAIEAVVDFGDLQIFEGVTTYPAIVTLKKARREAPEGSEGNRRGEDTLRFLNLRSASEDLSKHFEAAAMVMPRTRLTMGSWRFESDVLDSIRAKMRAGRRTLSEMFGAPLYGIKTGLNKAFVLTCEERDAIVAHDGHSVELLKPFLMGESLRKWHIESQNLWLIYTPKNRVDIEEYPAIRDHLAPFRERLEARATKQEWWELQQAQAAYEPHFTTEMVVWRDISKESTFSWMSEPSYLDCTCFFLPTGPKHLLGFLGSAAFWFQLAGMTPIASGGYYRLKSQYFERIWPCETIELESSVNRVSTASAERANNIAQVHHRLGDLAPTAATIPAFRDWPDLDFAGLRTLLHKRCRTDIPVRERDDWERFFETRKADVAALDACIKDAEAEINDRVYRLFDLTADEIAAIKDSLALASPVLGGKTFEAISAVEGMELTPAGRRRVEGPESLAERRAKVAKAYAKVEAGA